MAAKELARKFNPIGSHALLSHAKIPGSQSSPQIILLFGWMDAKLPHLYKYTEGYNALYPGADQILIRSDGMFFWRTRQQQNEALLPVVKVLKDYGIESLHDESARLLVHTLSNGGCLQFITLAKLLAQNNTGGMSSEPRTSVFSAFVFDSCPGTSSLVIFYRAFSVGIQNPILRKLSVIPISVAYFLHWTFGRLTGRTDTFVEMRNNLIDPTLIPNSAPRLYFYSTPDLLIPPKDVEEHIEQAKSIGGVRTIVVKKHETAPHVSQMRLGPQVYWESVRNLWEGVVAEHRPDESA